MFLFRFYQNLSLVVLRPDQAPKEYQRVSAHLVHPSPWPFLTAMALGSLLLGSASYFHSCSYGLFNVLLGLIVLVFSMYSWFADIIYEADEEGHHTQLVQKALRYGMFLFIVSEIMFFVSFFWAFFHFSLSPSVFLFCIWPPKGITTIDPWGVPFLNTVILLYSGVTLTATHRALLVNNEKRVFHCFLWTIVFGLIFTLWQLFEYINCPFSINDSVYGSIFFMATGFHGLHVIVGTIFLLVCFIRWQKKQLNRERHLSFECAAYYWHFVDVVWLFLFTSIYWWGS